MSFICPVCNGLQPLSPPCPHCQQTADDCGRFHDWLGPYSPYRDIQEAAMSNGFADAVNHLCIHVLHCPSCSREFTVPVSEKYLQ